MFHPQNANQGVALGLLKITDLSLHDQTRPTHIFIVSFNSIALYLKRRRVHRHLNLFPESDVLWPQPPTTFEFAFFFNVQAVVLKETKLKKLPCFLQHSMTVQLLS